MDALRKVVIQEVVKDTEGKGYKIIPMLDGSR
jgi:hypothetical protein